MKKHSAEKTNELGPVQRCRKHYTHGLKKIAELFRSKRHFGENWKPYSAVIKNLYASKKVKENALVSEGKSCRPETITTVNQYVCHDLSV